jgi:uncharacterized phage infection (PIP) family protein YhgE
MKNKVAAWGFVLVSCINPSLETGLDTLRDEIEKLQSQVQVVDVSGLVESVTELESTVDTLVIEFDTLDTTMNELHQMITTLQEGLDNLQQQLSTLAPNGTLQEISIKLEKIQEGIDVLVARADYDIDGVINAIDECPDTPITEIKQVNDVGCSPSQLND